MAEGGIATKTGLRFRHALSRVWDYNLGATIGQDRIGTSPDRQRAENLYVERRRECATLSPDHGVRRRRV